MRRGFIGSLQDAGDPFRVDGGRDQEGVPQDVARASSRQGRIGRQVQGGTFLSFSLLSFPPTRSQIGEAYAILSDPQRRRKFDAGIDESDPMSGMGNDFGDMGGFPGHGQIGRAHV